MVVVALVVVALVVVAYAINEKLAYQRCLKRSAKYRASLSSDKRYAMRVAERNVEKRNERNARDHERYVNKEKAQRARELRSGIRY